MVSKPKSHERRKCAKREKALDRTSLAECVRMCAHVCDLIRTPACETRCPPHKTAKTDQLGGVQARRQIPAQQSVVPGCAPECLTRSQRRGRIALRRRSVRRGAIPEEAGDGTAVVREREQRFLRGKKENRSYRSVLSPVGARAIPYLGSACLRFPKRHHDCDTSAKASATAAVGLRFLDQRAPIAGPITRPPGDTFACNRLAQR